MATLACRVYAVPNEINNILSTSVSGSLTHWFKNTLDYKMGSMIIIGGVVGTTLGMTAFNFFNEIGKLSLIISLSYMYLLSNNWNLNVNSRCCRDR